MDSVRRELEKMRANSRGGSFLLEDGTRFEFDPQPQLAQEFVGHTSACIRADLAREMRPEPHRYYRAIAKARDRKSAFNMLYDWEPTDKQHPPCPYNAWVLVGEGRIEDVPFARSGYLDGVGYVNVDPIPHSEGAE